MVTTATLSRDYCRKLAFTAENVEKRNGIYRNDLFDVGDVIAFKPNYGIFLIQAYRKGAKKEHEHLDASHPTIKLWLESGGRFVHHEWHKFGKRGKRKQWVVKVTEFMLNTTLNYGTHIKSKPWIILEQEMGNL